MFTECNKGFSDGPGKGVGVVLDREREQSRRAFSTQQMTHLIYGGEEKLQRHRFLISLIEREPIFRKWDKHYLTRPQLYERGILKTKRLQELVKEHHLDDPESYSVLAGAIDDNLPVGLHHSMFIPTLEGQGNEEQKKKWLPLAKNYGIIGTYAQTEMQHGSFLRGLETTSTYDAEKQQFVLHSPSLTATKWWPGNLGKSSTHCVVMARLITKGKDYGMHAFLVQLRDLETHQPLPGITLGDIGPKYGYETNDNGFLRLEKVRIPRDQMLMRFASVDKEGNYSPAPHAKLSYGTMIYVRASIVIGSSRYMARALTIAIRYSCVRRQFEVIEKSNGNGNGSGQTEEEEAKEEQIINYQSQQHLLFPLLASTYAFHFLGVYMKELYAASQKQLNAGSTALLKEVHVNSSGLKAMTTQISADTIEVCRKAMGGHGYSRYSGLIDLLADWIPACTYEGENNLMFLQMARDLLKTFTAAVGKRATAPGLLDFANNLGPFLAQKSAVRSQADWLSSEHQLETFRHRSARILSEVADRLSQQLKAGVSAERANENCKVDMIRIAKAHCCLVVLNNFVKSIASLSGPYQQLQPVLKDLCDLYALSTIEKELGEFTADGFISYQQTRWVSQAVRDLLNKIRPYAVGLVDAFDFSDFYLNSALGKWDGNVYEALYKWANTGNPMNQSNIAPGVKEHLLPLMKKNREEVQKLSKL